MPGPLGTGGGGGGGGTSVTQVTFAESTAAPNATVYVDSIKAAGATTHADLALSPKGAGALTAHVADGTTTGGNKRGLYAVDWQTFRGSQVSVASGLHAVVAGGQSGQASGVSSVVSGGEGNIASALLSTVAGGSYNTATSRWATVSGGGTNQATGFSSTIPGGYFGLATQTGKFAYSSGPFSASGTAQFGLLVQRAKTSTNSAVMLLNDTTDGTIYDATSLMSLRDFQVVRFTIDLAANSSPVGASQDYNYGTLGGMWTITGAVRRANGIATTAIVGTPTVVAASVDSALAAVSFTVLEETTSYGALQITATGLASTYIRWCAIITMTEVGYT